MQRITDNGQLTTCRLATLLAAIVLTHAAARAESWTVRNPTGQTYTDEAIRLHLPVPPEPFALKQDGKAAPYQVEEVDGKPFIWALVSFGKNEKRTFTTEPGARAVGEPKVVIRREGAAWLMDNGQVAVKTPAEAADLTPPLLSVRLPDGRWFGKGLWVTKMPLKKFASTLLADGQVFAKVRLRYDFDGVAGIDGKTPAYAVVDVAVYPGQRHVVIEESHEMARGDAWEFDICHGWEGRTPVFETFAGGAGRAKNPETLPKDLKPLGWDPEALQARYDRADPRLGHTLMWLVPRANQHYEDGWLFAITGGKAGVGASPCRAGRWFWPHDNKIAVQAKDSADYAGLRCPTRRGKRYWRLVVGAKDDFATTPAANHVLRYGYKGLDKVLIDYITDWPGKDENEGFYAGGFNPLFLTRGFLRYGGSGAPGNTPMDLLTCVQVILDPDMYGEYWQFWSPENPNFFTSFYAGNGVGRLSKLQAHPRYADLRRLAAMKVAEDVYHSFTLPSGAGQECPGYMSVGGLNHLVALCGGFPFVKEMTQRVAAALRFKRRISFPDGTIRRNNPMGDSHPGKGDGTPGMAPASVPADEVKGWKTEELQGYGVVFTNNPGTPQETFLAFKSGPNRGHYHGDQLAFHYCADARPLAVDHHCSYKPRAGQEHMHNRVAFFTDELPFANMDGYERLIAFNATPEADVAVGQVESDRLRFVQPFPPEDWDRDFPQVPLDPPLIYRRTVVLMKGPPHDYFVIRDQYQAARPLHAAYCLHVLDNPTQVLKVDEPEGGQADSATAAFTDRGYNFQREKVGAGWTLALHRAGKEERYRITGAAGSTLNLDAVPAAGRNIPYSLLKPDGQLALARPARYAVAAADGSFTDRAAGFARAGVQPGWRLFVRQGGRDRSYVIKKVEDAALTVEGAVPAGVHTAYRILKSLVGPALAEGRLALPGLTLFRAAPREARLVSFPWSHENGGLEATQGVRLEMTGAEGEFITVLFPTSGGVEPPAMAPLPGGVKVGADEIRFAGGLDQDPATTYVAVSRAGRSVLTLNGKDINLDRFQGNIGLFVPNTGYPFGEIPDWLIRQRLKPPAWYQPVLPLGYRQE